MHGLWRTNTHIIYICIKPIKYTNNHTATWEMLLDETIKAKSKFNYLIKLLIIKIYKQFLSSIFIAVTERGKNRY